MKKEACCDFDQKIRSPWFEDGSTVGEVTSSNHFMLHSNCVK